MIRAIINEERKKEGAYNVVGKNDKVIPSTVDHNVPVVVDHFDKKGEY